MLAYYSLFITVSTDTVNGNIDCIMAIDFQVEAHQNHIFSLKIRPKAAFNDVVLTSTLKPFAETASSSFATAVYTSVDTFFGPFAGLKFADAPPKHKQTHFNKSLRVCIVIIVQGDQYILLFGCVKQDENRPKCYPNHIPPLRFNLDHCLSIGGGLSVMSQRTNDNGGD